MGSKAVTALNEHLIVSCNATPLQLQGVLQGYKIYYRARSNHYSVHFTPITEPKHPATVLPLLAGACTDSEETSIVFALRRIAAGLQMLEDSGEEG